MTVCNNLFDMIDKITDHVSKTGDRITAIDGSARLSIIFSSIIMNPLPSSIQYSWLININDLRNSLQNPPYGFDPDRLRFIRENIVSLSGREILAKNLFNICHHGFMESLCKSLDCENTKMMRSVIDS